MRTEDDQPGVQSLPRAAPAGDSRQELSWSPALAGVGRYREIEISEMNFSIQILDTGNSQG